MMSSKFHQILSYIKHYFVAHRRGHGVHSPFAYQLCEEVFYNKHPFYAFEQLEKLREQLLQDESLINMEDYGSGSQVFKAKQRKVKDIAIHGISTKLQSELLFRLMNFMHSEKALELGTSLGLNTLYMAMSNSNTKVISIDACEDLVEHAKAMAHKQKVDHIQFIHAKFDEALPQLISQSSKIDFVYIDGNHSYAASMQYFDSLLEIVQNNTVLVFDDIYWSKDMTKAWEEIKAHPKVKLSIDTFYSGFIFFKEEIKEKLQYQFFL